MTDQPGKIWNGAPGTTLYSNEKQPKAFHISTKLKAEIEEAVQEDKKAVYEGNTLLPVEYIFSLDN